MMQSVFVIFAVTLVGATAGGGNSGKNTDSVSNKAVGVGVFVAQDSNGRRYGGTYDITEDDIPKFLNAPGFEWLQGNAFPAGFPFAGGDDFFQGFFRNFQPTSQDAFRSGGGRQKSDSSRGMGSNNNNFNNIGEQYARAGMDFGRQFIPGGGNFPTNFAAPRSEGSQASGGFAPDFMSQIMNFQPPQGSNSAYAAGSVGPSGTRQVASISPQNPNKPNIDISSRSGGGDGDGFYSVSSSSFASSSDNGGMKTERRGAKTVVNNNGNVKEYEVTN